MAQVNIVSNAGEGQSLSVEVGEGQTLDVLLRDKLPTDTASVVVAVNRRPVPTADLSKTTVRGGETVTVTPTNPKGALSFRSAR